MSGYLSNRLQMRWLLCALWVGLALLTFSFSEAPSPRMWLVLFAGAVIPPMILLRIWNEGPEPTVAEILRRTEDRR